MRLMGAVIGWLLFVALLSVGLWGLGVWMGILTGRAWLCQGYWVYYVVTLVVTTGIGIVFR